MKQNFLIIAHTCRDYITSYETVLNNLNLENRNLKEILEEYSFKSYLGGPAGIISNNFSRFKRSTGIITVLGNDELNKEYKTFFKKINAYTKIYEYDEPSSKCIIINNKNEQKIEWFDYASKHFNNIKPEKTFLENFEYLILSVCEPIVAKRFSKKFKGKIVYNPGQYLDYLPFNKIYFNNIIKKTNILSVNKKENKKICENLKIKNLNSLFETNRKLEIIIQTYGENGSKILTRNKTYKNKLNKKIEVIDPTGAGDVFLSTFLHYYSQNFPINIAQEKASLEASEIIKKEGGLF